mgnify:CR=1 FL=1
MFCQHSIGVTTITTGNVFVARSAPNPFRNRVDFSFTLPRRASVSVEIYSADGRRVQTLAQGDMVAGPHTLTWNGRSRDARAACTSIAFWPAPTGPAGKITRVD